jgi:cytochrome P450
MTVHDRERRSGSAADIGFYDHHDAELIGQDPFPLYAKYRQECPIGWSEKHGGFWVVAGRSEVDTIIHDPRKFSSYPVTLPPFPEQLGKMIPIEIDPPDHVGYRKILNAPFSPQQAKDLTGDMDRMMDDLIDQFIEDGHTDFAETVARPLPTMLAARILNLPLANGAKFQEWTDKIIHDSANSPEIAGAALAELYEFFGSYLNELRQQADPGGVLGALLKTEIDGQKFSDQQLLDFCLILLIASIDTTQKAIGSILWYLAEHPDLRRQLCENRSLIPSAVEEFLRYLSPVFVARTVTEDAEVGGKQLREGDGCLLILPSANRDESEFTDPDLFMPHRKPNRHLAFGANIHRCLGSHLARVELRVMLDRVLDRIPDYELAPGQDVVWATGQVQGMVKVPVVFRAAQRKHAATS